MFTITFFSTLITSLVFIVGGLKVYSSWHKSKDKLLRFFALFLLFFGMQQLFFAMGIGPFSQLPLWSNWFWIMAHVFMFIGISYFIRFPLRLKFPKLELVIFRAAIIYSLIGIAILFLNLSKVEPFRLSNGVYNWTVPAQSGAVIGIFTSICLLMSLAIFVYQGRQVKGRVLKLQSWLIAAGILIFLISGPIHNVLKTPLSLVLADLGIVSGAVLMIIGVYSQSLFKDR